jgi:hypothetical protein
MAANPRKSRPNKIDLALSDVPSHDVLDAKRTLRRHRGMIVGYARTSTTDQAAGLAAQERDLTAAGAERIFGEQVSRNTKGAARIKQAEGRVGSRCDREASRHRPEFGLPCARVASWRSGGGARGRRRAIEAGRVSGLITSYRNIPGATVANRISTMFDRAAEWAARQCGHAPHFCNCGRRGSRVGHHRPAVPVFRHMAAGDQHWHDQPGAGRECDPVTSAT